MRLDVASVISEVSTQKQVDELVINRQSPVQSCCHMATSQD